MLADSLQDIIDADSLPLWSYGLKKLPEFMLPVSDKFVQMKKRHATETIHLVEKELKEKSEKERVESREHREQILRLYRNMYRDNSASFNTMEWDVNNEVAEELEEVREELKKERRKELRRRMSDEKLRRRLERRKAK